MPELEDDVIFSMITDNLVLHTGSNGDTVVLRNIHFTKEQAGTIAWLVNHINGTKLKIQIKKV